MAASKEVDFQMSELELKCTRTIYVHLTELATHVKSCTNQFEQLSTFDGVFCIDIIKTTDIIC